MSLLARDERVQVIVLPSLRIDLFEGLGFRVWALGFRVQGFGLRVQGLGFRV